MTKREEYDLEFYKKVSNGKIRNFCRKANDVVDKKNTLQILSRLDAHETESLIFDLNQCITFKSNVDEGFFSDSVEDCSILYQYPNINIDDIITIPMTDMKMLLQEWLDFINT